MVRGGHRQAPRTTHPACLLCSGRMSALPAETMCHLSLDHNIAFSLSTRSRTNMVIKHIVKNSHLFILWAFLEELLALQGFMSSGSPSPASSGPLDALAPPLTLPTWLSGPRTLPQPHWWGLSVSAAAALPQPWPRLLCRYGDPQAQSLGTSSSGFTSVEISPSLRASHASSTLMLPDPPPSTFPLHCRLAL